MTQYELQEQIKIIITNNGFVVPGSNCLIPGTSLMSLCSTLAARLIDKVNIVEGITITREGTTIPPLEEKSMSVPVPPSEQPFAKTIATLTDIRESVKESIIDSADQLKDNSPVRPLSFYDSIMGQGVGIKLDNATELPEYATEHSSGFDLVANFVNEIDYIAYASKFGKKLGIDYFTFDYVDHEEEYKVAIMPGCSCPIPTGVYLEIPIGFEVQVRPRSGIATKQGLRLANCEGTIDADYRGEVIVAIYNDSKYPQEIKTGMKIAQAVLCPVSKANFIIKQELSNTDRGAGGFNSTGTNIKTK